MRRHNQLLFRTARSILKSDVESEDAVQEAYLLAWRAIGSFRADARLSTWLVRIVINQALARLRRRSAQIIPWTPPWTRSIPRCAWRWRTIPTIARSAGDARRGAPPDRGPHRPLPEAFRAVFMLRASRR